MAGLSISIQGGETVASSAVQASGSVLHVITANERAAFGIEDAALKGAVAKNFGQAPDDAFLCEPTPWGGLYNTYHWPQVQTSLVVQSAQILGITAEPVVLATKDFINSSAFPANFQCGVTDEVNNTTETNWSDMHTIDVNQTISYSISFLGTGGGGSTSFDYSYAWGEGGSESKSVTVGSSQGVSVDLAPGQKVRAKLSASRGVMKVRITYLASVTGTVAINYGGKFKDHHFWGLDLADVMRSASIPTTLTITEDIEVGYYSNATIELVDLAGALHTMLALGRPPVPGVLAPAATDAATQAKRRTVEDLKAFEAGKVQASAALSAKLDVFRATLSDTERQELGVLIDHGDATDGTADGDLLGNAFLKPMQRGGTGLEQEAFLKPMQRASVLGLGQEVFLKPMQRTEPVTEADAFLKPMQR